MKYLDNKMKTEDKNHIFVKNTDLASVYNLNGNASEINIKYVAIHDILAVNILMGNEFIRHNNRAVLTRVEFENQPTVIYRDIENIAAITYSKDIYFVPCNELVREVT